MSVYTPLASYLQSQRSAEVPVTFREVEKILGRKLPQSAYEHEAFWGNNTQGHVHAKAWRSIGWRTKSVNLESQKLVFARDRNTLAERLASADQMRAQGPNIGADIVTMIREDRKR